MAETARETVPLRKRRKLLRMFREQSGISLDVLGERSRLSKAMLSRFESGSRDLSADAWTRVLQAMTALYVETSAKRSAEDAKAKETAAKLGVFGLPSGLFEHLLKSDEQIAKEKADLQKECEVLDLLAAETEQLGHKDLKKKKGKVLAYILANPETVLKMYSELFAERDELKKRVAELEEEVRALKEQR